MAVCARTGMPLSQKVMFQEFGDDLMLLMDTYWNPSNSDKYWDDITSDAMAILMKYQTNDKVTTNFLSTIVASFLNSREEMLAAK